MPKIKVDPKEKYPRPYWPQELKDEGFVGEMLILDDALTATIIHPNASLEQVKKSLEIVLQDVALRMEKEKNKNSGGDNK
jgi:hypothetical protein